MYMIFYQYEAGSISVKIVLAQCCKGVGLLKSYLDIIWNRNRLYLCETITESILKINHTTCSNSWLQIWYSLKKGKCSMRYKR